MPSLVVAPTSVLPNWEREIERFTPQLTYVTWHGADRRDNIEKLRNVDLVLTSYALIRRDLEELKKLNFRTVILDEAQNIKNADSATAQACKAVGGEHRIALTGTPLENRLTELWSLFDFLMPGFLGNAETLPRALRAPHHGAGRHRDARPAQEAHPPVHHAAPQDRGGQGPAAQDRGGHLGRHGYRASRRCTARCSRRSKRKVYDSIDKLGFNKSRISILSALMKLRQVCCDPRLLKLPPGTALPPSAKLERFSELVDELVREGHRALVFSQFTEMLEILTNQADEKQLKYLYLDGRTKDRMGEGRRLQRARRPAGVLHLAQGRRHRASTSPPPTTSSTTIPGGTRPSKIRPPIEPTASARPARCSRTS